MAIVFRCEMKVIDQPRCIVIAGPNGAGKTTFAREFLLKDAGVVHFVNVDLIAAGLSPLKPDAATVSAGRIFLKELDPQWAPVQGAASTVEGERLPY